MSVFVSVCIPFGSCGEVKVPFTVDCNAAPLVANCN